VRTSAIFMSVPLVLFAYPPRKNETCGDEQHYQWDWPKRVSKPAPQPEKNRNQQQRKKQREQVSQQLDEHHPPASLADYSQQIALNLHRR
jgi:hypothetical protein